MATEHVHRVVRKMNADTENKSTVRWYSWTLYRPLIKFGTQGCYTKFKNLQYNIFLCIFRSSINDRHFLVRHQDGYRTLVYHSEVWRPLMYIFSTSNFSIPRDITIGTFTDGKTLITSDKDPRLVSSSVQNYVNKTQIWVRGGG